VAVVPPDSGVAHATGGNIGDRYRAVAMVTESWRNSRHFPRSVWVGASLKILVTTADRKRHEAHSPAKPGPHFLKVSW
jgi:hypothetical protein